MGATEALFFYYLGQFLGDNVGLFHINAQLQFSSFQSLGMGVEGDTTRNSYSSASCQEALKDFQGESNGCHGL